MWRAVVIEGEGDPVLGAPTVGRWSPDPGASRVVAPGERLGRLRRDGRWLEVLVPDGVSGLTRTICRPGTWVAYGAPLVAVGGSIVAEAREQAAGAVDQGCVGVAARAETDGTVYLSPQPGAPAFAPLGARVASNDVVALVEVMKTFSPVRAPIGGVVSAVRVQHAAAVTAGEILLVITPE